MTGAPGCPLGSTWTPSSDRTLVASQGHDLSLISSLSHPMMGQKMALVRPSCDKTQRGTAAGMGPLSSVDVECERDEGHLFTWTSKVRETCPGHGENEPSLPGCRMESQVGRSQEDIPRGARHIRPCPTIPGSLLCCASLESR